MSKPLSTQDLVKFLERALDIIEVSSPQPILVESGEYWDTVNKLKDDLKPYLEE